ncbi:AMP-binding protein [Klenkia brasiliensis]|uniref:Acyl-CoA synthetase (AMP-forming)/AMP-acid ligase II n=1 Tax=Klenkia brasiliensis TaxID=333142 RepID=A0A1G7YQ44_9ACTN|nr:AMP-binding protein [Klenkia brasiliensis]SDG98692.1 Acyl-CoA synthetase (AMP-forming)/AMP-acid ligase II [Klenkia brasiliensis]
MTAFPQATPAARERWTAAGAWDGTLLDAWVDAADPARLAVVDADVRLTYAELADRVVRCTAGLRRLGVGPGDVVAQQLPNWWEALVVHLATIRLGAVSNPLMPILRDAEMTFALRSGGARVLVVPGVFRGHDHTALAERLRPVCPALEHVVVARGGDFDDLLSTADGGHAEPGRSSGDPVCLLYTSGTESDPKGAVHSHDTLGHEDRSMVTHLQLTASDVVLSASPVAHVTGVLYGFHLASLLGTAVVFCDVWSPERGWSLITAEGCTVTVAATPFLHGLTHSPARPATSTLRVFGCGGADVPPELVREATRELDCTVVRVYGSTEIPTVTAGHADDPADLRADTDGRVVGLGELRVVDDEEREVPPGTVGHLRARAPEMFLGYHGLDRDVVDAEGWFATGDLGRVDDAGFLTVTGRSKDLILRGGENISAKEVEDHLYRHPDVADVAVVAVPDPVLTERGCAVVVPRPGATVTLESLTAFLDGLGIAKQKYPESLVLVGDLPRTPTGKVQKNVLRQQVRLRPDVQALVEKFATAGVQTYDRVGVAAARDQVRGAIRLQRPAPDVAGTYDVDLGFPARVYPGTTGTVLVYLHGGGFVLGDLEVVDRPCRALAAASGATVVSVAYRLAPESPFPGPVHDCLAAVRWARDLGDRLVLLGDSAGGALAAAVSTLLRDDGGTLPAAQLLVYPTLAPPTDTPSMLARADGPFMTRRELDWFWDLYLAGAEPGPLSAPLLADDLAGLPPTTVVVAELDPLRDEGRAYAARLREAGVPVELVEYPGAVHGFWWLSRALGQADELTADLARRVQR